MPARWNHIRIGMRWARPRGSSDRGKEASFLARHETRDGGRQPDVLSASERVRLSALLAGTYYWFPKISGRLLDERVGKLGVYLLRGHLLRLLDGCLSPVSRRKSNLAPAPRTCHPCCARAVQRLPVCHQRDNHVGRTRAPLGAPTDVPVVVDRHHCAGRRVSGGPAYRIRESLQRWPPTARTSLRPRSTRLPPLPLA